MTVLFVVRRCLLALAVVMAVVMAAAPMPARAAGSEAARFVEIERALGPVRALAITADHVYAGVGRRLQVYAVEGGKPPALVSEGPSESDDITDLEVGGGRLYLAAGQAGLRIYDIATDPRRPVLLGSYAAPGFRPRSLATDGQTLYAASGKPGIHVLDVQGAGAPTLLSVFSEPGVSYLSLRLGAANRLYAGASDGLFLVLDAADPYALQRLGTTRLPANGRQIALQGSLAFVAAGAAGLRIVDVADPSRPAELGHSVKPVNEDAVGVALNGSLAYVADRGIESGDSHYRKGGLRVIDVSDPAHPLQLANLAGDLVAVDTVGDQAIIGTYRTSRESSIDRVDISQPTAPRRLASVNVPIPASQALHAMGSSAYVADRAFNCLRLADPQAPHLAWSLALPDFDQESYAPQREFVFAPGRAYVDTQSTGVVIIDLADLKRPQLAGTIVPGAWPLAATGHHVVLKPFSGPARIYDAQVPSAPQWVGNLPGSDFVALARIAGLHLYAVDNYQHLLLVYDITDPAVPVLANQIPIGEAFTLDTEGQRLYLGLRGAFDTRRLQVYSLANAPLVALRGEVEIDRYVRTMAACDRIVYFAKPVRPGGGAVAVDATDATAPFVSARHELASEFAVGIACLPQGTVALNVLEGVLLLRYER